MYTHYAETGDLIILSPKMSFESSLCPVPAIKILVNNEKALRETQTLRAGCSKTDPKILPLHRPPPGGAGRPKFNQLEMVTTCTYRHSLVKIDARNFELSW